MSRLVHRVVSATSVLSRFLARFRERRTPALVVIARGRRGLRGVAGGCDDMGGPDRGSSTHAWFSAPAGQTGPQARPAGMY